MTLTAPVGPITTLPSAHGSPPQPSWRLRRGQPAWRCRRSQARSGQHLGSPSASAAALDASARVPEAAPSPPPARRPGIPAAPKRPVCVLRAAGEHLLRPETITPGDLGYDCVRLQRLRDDPRLVIQRPVTPAASTVDHLETPRLPLRLKRKVKSRHKPISDPNTGSATSQIAITPETWPRTAYAPQARPVPQPTGQTAAERSRTGCRSVAVPAAHRCPCCEGSMITLAIWRCGQARPSSYCCDTS